MATLSINKEFMPVWDGGFQRVILVLEIMLSPVKMAKKYPPETEGIYFRSQKLLGSSLP